MKIMKKAPFRTVLLGLASWLSCAPVWAGDGWLGVLTGPPSAVQITEVFKGSPADKMGLQRGDWVLELNGKQVLSQLDFARRIAESKPGSEVHLVGWRDGQKLDLRVSLDDQVHHPQWPVQAAPPDVGRVPMGMMGDLGPRRLPTLYGHGASRPSMLGHTHDYQQRLNSVESLLSALQRIAGEKGSSLQVSEVVRRVTEMVQASKEDFSRYRINEGRLKLDNAYAIVTQAVQNLRQGETLVHALNFANKREEFLYELDRYETFNLLKGEQLSQVPQKAGDAAVQDALKQAEENYVQAGRHADGGDFSSAVRLIEAANDAMVQALRKMGMDIPG